MAVINDEHCIVYLPFDTDFSDINNGDTAHTWSGSGASIDTTKAKSGGGSCYFDGTGCISTGDFPKLSFENNDFAVEFFIYTENNTTRQLIAGQTDSLGVAETSSFWIEIKSGILYFYISDGSNWYNVNCSIDKDRWVHIICKKEGEYLKICKDGSLSVSKNIGDVWINDVSYNLSVGCVGERGIYFFTGWIDEFAIHTIARECVSIGTHGFIIDGMWIRDQVTDGIYGYSQDYSTQEHESNLDMVLPHSDRALTHIRERVSVPANSSVTLEFKRIGNAGYIINPSIDNDNLSVEFQDTSYSNTETIRIIDGIYQRQIAGAGYLIEKDVQFHFNEEQNGNLEITVTNDTDEEQSAILEFDYVRVL